MKFWQRLLVGQALSLAATFSSVASRLLSDKTRVSYVALPTVCIYLLILLLHWRSHGKTVAHQKWFALAAISDVLANALIFAAFSYAPVAQISLLEDAAIPFSFCIDYFVLKRTRQTHHFLGTAMCTATIVFYSVMAGVFSSAQTSRLRLALGILYPLLSALAYSVSNAMQCHLVELYDGDTYMYYLGLYGFLASFAGSVPIMPREVMGLAGADGYSQYGLLAGVVCILVVFYVLLPRFISATSATFFNMSLMTKNFYIVAASELVLGTRLPWFSYVSFAGIFCSLLTFNYSAGVRAKGPAAAV